MVVDLNQTNETLIKNIIIKGIVAYGSEVQKMKNKTEKMLLTTLMGF